MNPASTADLAKQIQGRRRRGGPSFQSVGGEEGKDSSSGEMIIRRGNLGNQSFKNITKKFSSESLKMIYLKIKDSVEDFPASGIKHFHF